MNSSDILPIVNWIWRVPSILLMTAFLSTLSVFFSLLDGSGRLQHLCARTWAGFIFFVSRVKVDIEGLEHLDGRRGYVFMSNHLSMFDHWAFLYYVPFQFRFIAKSSLFNIPFLGWHLTRSGNVPVYYENHRKTINSYRKVSDQLKNGLSFVIYPEGMRTFDGVPVEFKRGAFLLPKEAKAPIVPVTLTDAHLRLKRGSTLIRPGKMGMIIHPPIEYEEYESMELSEIALKTRNIILERYNL